MLTACQSEPEVGTPLYTVAETSNLPKLYIHDLANQGNKGELNVVNANGELIVKKDTVEFLCTPFFGTRQRPPSERCRKSFGY